MLIFLLLLLFAFIHLFIFNYLIIFLYLFIYLLDNSRSFRFYQKLNLIYSTYCTLIKSLHVLIQRVRTKNGFSSKSALTRVDFTALSIYIYIFLFNSNLLEFPSSDKTLFVSLLCVSVRHRLRKQKLFKSEASNFMHSNWIYIHFF